MSMRRFVVAVFVVLAFSGMAVAQPAAAGPGNGPGGPPGDVAPDQDDGDDVDEEDDSPEEDSDDESERGPPEDLGADVENASDEVNETEDENETEMDDVDELNETRGPPEGVPGRSAQFDARLMTAINTLDALVDIAPSDEASSQLQEALDIMRDVQNSTDTASLGPEGSEDDSETEMNETEENETVENESEADLEDEESGEEERQGRGPPGFVRNFIGGILGR